MNGFQLLSLFFLISSASWAGITLNLTVTPTGSEDAEEAMDCEMTLYRGRQNPEATIEGIKSNMVATTTRIRGYRLNAEKKSEYVNTSKSGLISLDFDFFSKNLAALAKTPLKGFRGGGPIGPRVVYSGEIDGVKFTLRDTSEFGEVYNPHEDEDMLRTIVLRACYGK